MANSKRHDGAVAADDGDRGGDAAVGDAAVDGGEQAVDMGDEPGVEDGGGGAADGVERATDGSAGDDGAVGQFGDDFGGADFVLGVADGEVAGDGEGVDLMAPAVDGAAQSVFVEGGALLTEDVVPAGDELEGGGVDAVEEAVAAKHGLVVADEEGADAATEAFDGGVGGEGGGERATRVIWEGATPWRPSMAAVMPTARSVWVVGVLCQATTRPVGGVEGDGVGVGAAGVDAEDEGHGVMVARIEGLCTPGGVGGFGGLVRVRVFSKKLLRCAGVFLAGSGVRRGPKPGHRRSAAVWGRLADGVGEVGLGAAGVRRRRWLGCVGLDAGNAIGRFKVDWAAAVPHLSGIRPGLS